MAFELMPLPYDPEALEPAVSARTLGFHHGKHHKAYIDKTNAAIEGTANADKGLTEVIAAARGSNQGLFNNAAQSWNHGFYWNSLAPSGGSPKMKPIRFGLPRWSTSAVSVSRIGTESSAPVTPQTQVK